MRTGLGVASVALVVLSACGGPDSGHRVEIDPVGTGSSASVDWQTACPDLQAALDSSLNNGAVIHSGDEWNSLTDGVGQILTGLAPEPQLQAVEDASRAAAMNAEDPDAGPEENLRVMGAWLDSMEVVTAICEREGAPLG